MKCDFVTCIVKYSFYFFQPYNRWPVNFLPMGCTKTGGFMSIGHSWLTPDLAHESALCWAWLLWAALAHESAVNRELAQQLC